jgi:hypothetical protein
MAIHEITVEVYTSTHQIRGKVDPGPLGMFTLLSRPTESYLELETVELSPLYLVGSKPEECSKIWVVKNEISVVVLGSRGELSPPSGARSGYTKPFPHSVRVLVDGYELKGQIESGGRFDFGSIMSEGTNAFIPLYDGKLTAVLFPKVSSQSPAMVFNRARVEVMSSLRREGDF